MTGCEQTSAQEKKIRPSFRPVPNGRPLGAKLKLTCRELTGSICMSLGVAGAKPLRVVPGGRGADRCSRWAELAPEQQDVHGHRLSP